MKNKYFKAALLGIIGVIISVPFLFGQWVPLSDVCVASSSNGDCQGLLSFLSKEFHIIVLILVFGLIAFNVYDSEES